MNVPKIGKMVIPITHLAQRYMNGGSLNRDCTDFIDIILLCTVSLNQTFHNYEINLNC